MPDWTRRLAVALCLMFAASSVGWAQNGDAPLRKNIDDLTAAELAAYEHAVQILKDRNQADPYDEEGYLWQAWIHNCMKIFVPKDPSTVTEPTPLFCDRGEPPPDRILANPGMCEHGKDIFLLWHRAQFYYFEQLLRATDPEGLTGPSTADVAVPFWNWTRPPSGARYPKAFEDPTSPLYHENRLHHALLPEERERLEGATSARLTAALIYGGDWPRFGGYPQAHPTGGKGEFESAQHDLMHAFYFGGDMANPTTAALDPGFWSFHAYIDLILEFWLRENGAGTMTSLDQFLRGTQPTSITPAPGHENAGAVPSMGRARIYLDTTQLGFGFEVKPQDRLPPRDLIADLTTGAVRFGASAQSPFARLAGDGFNNPDLGQPTQIAQLPVALNADTRNASVQFARPNGAADVSFAVDFYFHPPNVTPDMADRAFRERFIVASRGYWGSGQSDAGAHAPAKPLFLDLSEPMQSLLPALEGQVWVLTAVVSGPDVNLSFGRLSLLAGR